MHSNIWKIYVIKFYVKNMLSLNVIILIVARIFNKSKNKQICTYTDFSSLGFIQKFRNYKLNLVPCSELRVNCFSFHTNATAVYTTP